MKQFIFNFIVAIFAQLLTFSWVEAQFPAYKIYNSKGKAVKNSEILKKLRGSQLVFFGELHNNSMAHWLTWEILQQTYKIHPNLAIGMEMLETDQQTYVTDYLESKISRDSFLRGKLWPNHKTDYQPVLDFALNNKLPVIASNIPRRYAKFLYQNGMESLAALGDTAKQFFPPIPFEVPYHLASYMMLRGEDTTASTNFVQAQAVKDYTMAYNICKYLPEKVVFHVNGSYHSDFKESIAWYVKRKFPNITILNFTVLEGNPAVKPLYSELKKADFIIVIPENMHHSYE